MKNGILDKMENKLLIDYLGEEKAHSRIDLLQYLRIFYPSLSDRKMREIYSENFVIGHKLDAKNGKKGIYYTEDPDILEKVIQELKRMKETYENKIKRAELQKQKMERMRFREMEQRSFFEAD